MVAVFNRFPKTYGGAEAITPFGGNDEELARANATAVASTYPLECLPYLIAYAPKSKAEDGY